MKAKININRPDISSEEIAKHADFNRVIAQAGTGSAKYGKVHSGKTIFNKGFLITATGLILTSVIMYFVFRPDDPPQDFVFAPQESERPVPAPVVDVVPEYFLFSNEEGCNCQNHRGSKIIVPPKAFERKDGKQITGQVRLKYSEYMDVFEIMMAGIPMVYDSAGGYHFETGGMFALYAFDDEDTLIIANGKAIDVWVLSDDTTTDHRSYHLGADNKWNFLEHNQLATFSNKLDGSRAESTRPLSGLQELTVVKQEIEGLEKQLPEEPKTYSNKGYRFTLDVLPDEFPELLAFQGMEFEVLRGSAGWNELLYETRWDNIMIKDSKIKGYLTMTLTNDKKERHLEIYPVYGGEAYQSAMVNYKTALAKQNSLIEKKKKEYAEKEMLMERLVQSSKESEQIQMERSQADLQKRNIEQEFFRTFRVTTTGVFNCDKPLGLPSGTSVFPLFADKDGNKISVKPVHLVEIGRNALFTFSSNRFEKISYNPNRKNVLWGYTSDGRFAYASGTALPKLPESMQEYKFSMTVLDTAFSSADENACFIVRFCKIKKPP
jgi:hypothetical protein